MNGIDALRQDGVDQFDPVRFHYIEALARRAGAHQGLVRRILDARLTDAAAALRERFELAQMNEQSDALATTSSAPGEAQNPETLGDLVRHLARHFPDTADGGSDTPLASRPELKSVRYFRNTWSRLSAEKQVTQALGQAPKNAGPINSHVVALRSLALMRDASPDYLNRFMAYVDTLLCLEQQSEKAALPAAKPPRAAKAARK